MSDEGSKALAELKAHVQVCDERYKNIESTMARMSTAIERMGGKINGAAMALIGGLFMIVGYFIVKHGV